MSKDTSPQGVLFNDLSKKALVARFDQPDSSSDGGAILLKACDRRLGLIDAISGCVRDDRCQGKVRHSLQELISQRVYGIACGYEDCNDSARLGTDPVQRLLIDRDPLSGEALASQPTLSRFENGIDGRSLVGMGTAIMDTVIARHRRRLGNRVRRITIDLDPTDDATFGQQQLSFFNGHYGSWCYLPLACFLQFNEEPDQYLFACVLRGGDAPATEGVEAILRRVLARLRKAFGNIAIRVRLDGGFATPELFDFLEGQRLEYAVAMGKNSVLKDFAEPLMDEVRHLSYRSGETEKRYGECQYEAQSWDDERRVIFKAEVVRHPGREAKDNPRFVVTNLKTSPTHVYERVYCQRAVIENRIKELLLGLQIDRTSCTRFFANQFRVLLTVAAYVLFQELRINARNTSFAHAQVTTLRERVLKLAVWVERSTRRVVFHLPDSAPWRSDWCRIARALGAAPI
jgi:hypothetical protein